jgi:phage protein D
MPGNYKPVYSPRYTVTVGGTTYEEVGGLVEDLVVETTVDGADFCSFTLSHPFDPEQHDFADLNWGDTEPGTSLEVAVGWGGAGSTETVFVGKTHATEVEFTPAGGGRVTVSGYGVLHEMMRGITERSWEEVPVTTAVQEVLGDYGGGSVKGSTSERKRIIQHNQNDYRFVRELADEYGFEFYAQQGDIYFDPRASILVSSVTPDVTFTYGNTLDRFSAEITTANQLSEVEVRYWDMNQEKEIVGSASKSSGKGKEVFRIACDSKAEAEQIARSKLSALSMVRATGHGETDGIPELSAGMTVRIEGVGERFVGNYYVTRVTHRMQGNGYRTTFDVTELPEV